MNDRSVMLIHLILAIGVPSGVLAYYAATGMTIEGLLFGAIMAFCMIPIIAFGMYMWVSGRGQMWINGVNWKALDESQSKRTVRLMGITMALFCLGIYACVALILEDFMLFIYGFVALMVLLFVFIYYVNSKKYRAKPATDPKMSTGTMVLVSVLVVMLSVVPAMYTTSMLGDGNINVNVTDDYISVEGPMFEYKEFKYDEIERYFIAEDFPRGSRTNGFGTSSIQSGHFLNSWFGDYMLASYTSSRPCVVIFYGGEEYAFNQQTVEETRNIFEQLEDKMSIPPQPWGS